MKLRPTAARLRELLHYDPLTGAFTRRVKTCNSVSVGDVAGYIAPRDGYWRISVDSQQYLGHVLAWLYMTGEWPAHEIDHRNTDRSNNVWENLRDLPTAINSQNKRCARVDNLSCGLLGVTFDKGRARRPWVAQIGLMRQDGKRRTIRIGRFETPQLAHAAYLARKREIHPGCTI